MKLFIKWTMFFILMAGFSGIAHGCAAAGGEGVAIYLTRDDIPPASMEMLSHVELAEQPIIGEDDIVSYNMQTFELKMTPAAYERLTQLKVPTTGKSFLVCVNHSPVYWGAFWTPFSSQSFDGVTIWQPYNADQPPIVTIDLGYPTPSFYTGEDPRNKPLVIDTLRENGKLITALTLADVDTLPFSAKGYEIYSWQDGDAWQFALITGTNRNKTEDEIISGETFISETGWIHVPCAGEDELKAALDKVQAGDFIIFLDGGFVSENDQLSLPPQEMLDQIKTYARERGLTVD